MFAPHELAGEVCAVTGGAQGIGWALTEALVAEGAHVHVCDICDTYLSRAESRRAALSARDRITLARCDVSQGTDLSHWISGIQEQEGRIDILINNAAFVRWESVERMTVEDCEQTFRTGYDAAVRAVKLVLPMMRAAGHGHIVNMGSSAGRIITGHSSAAYAACKAAMEAFTETFRLELSGEPIGVTLVRPGVVAGTSFFVERVRSHQLPRLADFLPYSTPPQVAAAVVEAIRNGRPTVDVPGSLRMFYLLHALFPQAVRRAARLGNGARRDFGTLPWISGERNLNDRVKPQQ